MPDASDASAGPQRWTAWFFQPCPAISPMIRGACAAALIAGAMLFPGCLLVYGWGTTVRMLPPPVSAVLRGLSDGLRPAPSAHPRVRPDPYPGWRAGVDVFVRAPLKENTLPCLDAPDAPVDEAAKQIDYALIQTMLRLGLERRAVRLVSREYRQSPRLFLFQRLRVYLPAGEANAPDTFFATLRHMLSLWNERARVIRVAPLRLRLEVEGIATHELFLSPEARPALPAAQPGEPLLTIVIDDMGAGPEPARQLLRLGIPLTLAVWPHAVHAGTVSEMAWGTGNEVLIHQPAEPRSARMHPGPDALKADMSAEAIGRVLARNVQRVPHAVGVNNHMGSRFTADRAACAALSVAAAGSGLFVLDSLTHPSSVLAAESARQGVTTYKRSLFLDDNPSPPAILAALREAERMALASGRAIAIGHPHPETISALREWAQARNTAIRLVPLREQPSVFP